jgi:hypothetical protein
MKHGPRQPNLPRAWRWSVVWLVGWSGGCGLSGDDQVSDPLPDWPIVQPESLTLSYDGEGEAVEGLGQGLGVRGQALVGDDALLARPLVSGLELANTMTLPALRKLNEIARGTAPILANEQVRVWQSRGEDLNGEEVDYQLVISRSPQVVHQWDYVLLVYEPGPGSSVVTRPLLSGFFQAEEGYTDERQIGAGLIRYHYGAPTDPRHARSPVKGFGAVAFRILPSGARKMSLILDDFQVPTLERPLKARYGYLQRPDKGGVFSFALKANLLKDESRNPDRETIRATIAWEPDLRARGLAQIGYVERVQGQDNSRTVLLDECWDARRKQVWVQWDPGAFASDGDERDCGEGLADLTLALPDPREIGRDENPDIPTE